MISNIAHSFCPVVYSQAKQRGLVTLLHYFTLNSPCSLKRKYHACMKCVLQFARIYMHVCLDINLFNIFTMHVCLHA